MQYIARKGNFDAGHRIMNEHMKCFNMHGHTYLYELTFIFNQIEEIGYAIDFKEIKRIGVQWIEDTLDHGMLLNPKDKTVINAAKITNSKYWIMSLNGNNYCNPSVENIAKEIFLAMELLFEKFNYINIKNIRLYETPNCYTDCFPESISVYEKENFLKKKASNIMKYATSKGKFEYDDRKLA